MNKKLFLLALPLLLSACGKGPTTINVESVDIVDAGSEMLVSETHQLTTNVLPADATNKKVTYSSSNTAVATVSPSGVVTAVGSGDVTITATTEDGQKTDTCDFTVVTPKTRFVRAKTKTYENQTYEYTYEANASIKFAGELTVSPAKISGTIQYNENAAETNYMHKKDVSGALVWDYTTYTYNIGNDLITLNANESKDFSVVNNGSIPSNYDFETNSIGVLLKQLSDNENLSVTKSGEKYNLALKTNFAQDSALSALNKIDSKKLIDKLSAYTTEQWGVGFTNECYAILNSDNKTVKDFHFGFGVNIKDVFEISFTFDQHFTKIGGGISIELPTFDSTFTKPNEITTNIAPLANAYKDAKNAYYEYLVKTGVDRGIEKGNPLGLAVNSTSDGWAKRETINNEVYFMNFLEFDSDYKNADQYKSDGVVDYNALRGKINTSGNPVYDQFYGVLLKDGDPVQVTEYDKNVDDYYMCFDESLLTSDCTKLLRVSADKKNNKTYKLGIGSDTIKSILEHYNDSIRIDKAGNLDVKVYDIASDFQPKKSEIEMVLDGNGKLTTVDMEFKGFYVVPDGKQVKFTFKLELEFDYTKTYSAITSVNNLKK